MKTATNRIEAIDYLRGWAILGIILVNIFTLGASGLFKDEFYQLWTTSPLEKGLLFVRANLLDNRIFPILSLLFGWGIGKQKAKAGE